MKVICLSAGHNLTDPGAIHEGVKESAINMAVTKLACDMLRKHGVGVLEVPDDVDLSGTIKWINERGEQVDLCVDIHCNKGGGTGTEVWYLTGSPESQKLSQFIADAVKVESGLPSRGIKDNNWFGFNVYTKPLSCLVECAFIDTESDVKILTSPDGQRNIAKGIVRGILGYLGEAWKPELLEPVILTLDYKKLYEDLKRENDAVKDANGKLLYTLNLIKEAVGKI